MPSRKKPAKDEEVLELFEDELVPLKRKEVLKKTGVIREDIFEETSYFRELSFKLEEDETVVARAVDMEGGIFNFYVMDTKNFTLFSRGEKYHVQREARNVSSVHITFKAPETGTWYLVFELSRKQTKRTIELRFSEGKGATSTRWLDVPPFQDEDG